MTDTRPIKRDAEVTAGTLHLRVKFTEWASHGDGIRPRYAVRVTDLSNGKAYRDPYGVYGPATREPIHPVSALGALVAFLSASAESYGARMQPYDPSESDAPDFPAWLQESAYMNDSELAMAGLDLEDAERQYA